MSVRSQAHRPVVRPLDIPLDDDKRWATWALTIASGVILGLVFLVVIPWAGLVLGAALGVDMTVLP